MTPRQLFEQLGYKDPQGSYWHLIRANAGLPLPAYEEDRETQHLLDILRPLVLIAGRRQRTRAAWVALEARLTGTAPVTIEASVEAVLSSAPVAPAPLTTPTQDTPEQIFGELFEGVPVRMTPGDDPKISILDVLAAVGYAEPKDAWRDLRNRLPELVGEVPTYRFSASGGAPTPVASRKTFLKILGACSNAPDPSRLARFREWSASILDRYIAGDETLAAEVLSRKEVLTRLAEIEGKLDDKTRKLEAMARELDEAARRRLEEVRTEVASAIADETDGLRAQLVAQGSSLKELVARARQRRAAPDVAAPQPGQSAQRAFAFVDQRPPGYSSIFGLACDAIDNGLAPDYREAFLLIERWISESRLAGLCAVTRGSRINARGQRVDEKWVAPELLHLLSSRLDSELSAPQGAR
jgi:hypothetical protein